MSPSLRQKGEYAKNLFRNLVTNVRRSNDFSDGDTEVFLDGEWHHIDVKTCSSNSVNQVRAIRYETLVIYKENYWYVIPPNEVVRLVAQKSRGQHTEIPFECSHINLSQVKSVYRCSDSQLAERVYAAIRMSQQPQYNEVREVMENLSSELIKIKEKAKSSINALFEK